MATIEEETRTATPRETGSVDPLLRWEIHTSDYASQDVLQELAANGRAVRELTETCLRSSLGPRLREDRALRLEIESPSRTFIAVQEERRSTAFHLRISDPQSKECPALLVSSHFYPKAKRDIENVRSGIKEALIHFTEEIKKYHSLKKPQANP